MGFKVLNGTPKSGKTLCLSCDKVGRRLGQNLEDQIFCSSWKFANSAGDPSIVPFRVSECTEYQPFNQQSLKDMYELAWDIRPVKRQAGFKGPEDGSCMDIEIVPPEKKKSESD